MKTVTIAGAGQAQLVDRPDPTAVDELAVVRVEVAPMCTEYKAYREGWISTDLGHEAAGVVESVARRGQVERGDRVVVMPMVSCGKCFLCLAGDYIHCQRGRAGGGLAGQECGSGTYAQKLLKADWQLVPIPEDVSTVHAAMACCGLGPTFGAMQRMGVCALDTVLVTGLGPVGLGAVINGVFRNARVLAVESHPYRASLARELGAEAVIDPSDPDALQQIRSFAPDGVDKAVDCSGAAPAQRLLIDAVRRRGHVAFVGEAAELVLHVSKDMIRKGITLHGSWHYNLADTPRVMAMIRRVGSSIDRLVTHRFPMSRVQDAFELQLTGNCGKVLLDPWS